MQSFSEKNFGSLGSRRSAETWPARELNVAMKAFNESLKRLQCGRRME